MIFQASDVDSSLGKVRALKEDSAGAPGAISLAVGALPDILHPAMNYSTHLSQSPFRSSLVNPVPTSFD
jgi:hypothetical protein